MQKNTTVIRTIGLVCNYDYAYDMYPSWIYYPKDSNIIAQYQSNIINFRQNPVSNWVGLLDILNFDEKTFQTDKITICNNFKN